MYAAFVAVAAACGTPALMATLTFGFFANCPISLTHYGNGCGPVYYGAGYVSQSEWWRNGLVICTMNAAIWLTIAAVLEIFCAPTPKYCRTRFFRLTALPT